MTKSIKSSASKNLAQENMRKKKEENLEAL